MIAVILAAGEGVRMRPLTLDTHKSMLRVLEKPIMEHIFDALPRQIDEVILVVGYMQDRIREYFGDRYGRLSLRYIVQEKKLGTYHALKLCEPFLKKDERFFVMYADDLHDSDGLQRCVDRGEPCMLVAEADDPRPFGVIELNRDGSIKSVEEKPEHPKSNLVAVGVYVLTTDIFKYPARQHSNGEYYLTDSIENMISTGHKIFAERSKFWLPIGYPEDIMRAEEILGRNKKGPF